MEDLVLEDRVNDNNLGQQYVARVEKVYFKYVDGQVRRRCDLSLSIRNEAGEVVQHQVIQCNQNSPIPFGRISVTVGMISKSQVVLAVHHPHWLRVYPTNLTFTLREQDLLHMGDRAPTPS